MAGFDVTTEASCPRTAGCVCCATSLAFNGVGPTFSTVGAWRFPYRRNGKCEPEGGGHNVPLQNQNPGLLRPVFIWLSLHRADTVDANVGTHLWKLLVPVLQYTLRRSNSYARPQLPS